MIRSLTLIALAVLTTQSAHAALKLSPQTVVDLALKQGLEAKRAELEAQRSYLTLQQALGEFDFQISLKTGYEYNQAQTIAGVNNLVDRTLTTTGLLSKRIRTGTTFELEYINTQQASILDASSAGNRLPNAHLQSTQLTLRQALWRNTFGYADRLGVAIGETGVKAAHETRDEALETVLLDAMTRFWETYTADQQLQEDIAAREKYEQLVRNVRRRSGFNLATPGELPRLEAELITADQKVKTSSAAYLASVDRLLTALQIKTGEQVSIEVPNALPPVPKVEPKNVENLRTLRIAQLNYEIADRNLRRTKWRAYPQFDLVARGRTTGVDEDRSRASAEMNAINYPTYFIGVEISTALDSDLLRGQIADAEVQFAQSQNNLNLERDNRTNELRDFERQVSSQYSVAKTSLEVVELRDRVVRQLEAAYRQGRQPLVELIRAYNDLFAAQRARAKAVGDYHIILNRWAASRDELVGNNVH